MFDSDNRWVLFRSLMPCVELEEAYAPQFSPTTGSPAKPVWLALGPLLIQLRVGLKHTGSVEQIRQNPYMQIILFCWLF